MINSSTLSVSSDGRQTDGQQQLAVDGQCDDMSVSWHAHGERPELDWTKLNLS